MGLLTTIGMPQTPCFHVGKTMPLAPAMTGNGNGFSIPPTKKNGVFSWGMVLWHWFYPQELKIWISLNGEAKVWTVWLALWPWGMDISSATEISQSPVDSSGGPPSDDLGQNVTNQCRCCQVSLHPNDLFAVCFEPPASQIGITTSDTQVADEHARIASGQ